jgi:hypothetical protein
VLAAVRGSLILQLVRRGFFPKSPLGKHLFPSTRVIPKRGEVGISAVEKLGTTILLHGLVRNHMHGLFFFASQPANDLVPVELIQTLVLAILRLAALAPGLTLS